MSDTVMYCSAYFISDKNLAFSKILERMNLINNLCLLVYVRPVQKNKRLIFSWCCSNDNKSILKDFFKQHCS